MKLSVKNSIITVAALLLPVFVFAIPAIPHQFYGTVDFKNGPAVDGLLIEAKVDNITIGSSVTEDGKYGYSPNLFFASDLQNTNAGKIIEFYVSGINSGETYIFNNGASNNLNLSVEGVIGTIEETDESKTIEDEVVVVGPESPMNVKLGDSLNINISSEESTNAEIAKIEKLESNFFTGATAIIAGNNLLNAFEIDITGDDLTISVSITYDDSNIDEDTVKPYRFNGTSWVEITEFNINKTTNTITFAVSSAQTPYVIFGVPLASEGGGDDEGGGGGGGGGYIPPVSTSGLSEAARAVDANNDDKIDVFDFNILMINWGSTAVDNLADFDNNNKVDIFDFNLLMIHWVNL